MKKRLLIFLTCCALIISAFGHMSGLPIDRAGGAVTSASLSEPVANGATMKFEVGMDGCIGHVHNPSGRCTIDAVTSSLSFDAPDQIWRVSNWVETASHLKEMALSPTPPPPISVS